MLVTTVLRRRRGSLGRRNLDAWCLSQVLKPRWSVQTEKDWGQCTSLELDDRNVLTVADLGEAIVSEIVSCDAIDEARLLGRLE